jgi:NTP pyrophosphatase (non-canonical NTP hydrolase)
MSDFFINAWNDMQRKVHASCVAKGFWPEDKSQRNVGEAIALIHSELSEGLEGHRKGLQDDHVSEFTSLEVELADAVIRILDLAGGLNLRVAEALIAKHSFNQSRPFKHGKKY